jgi:ubiquitin carboxyl-terminal hydrolase 36/42
MKGLKNFGNTCFINSIIQILSAIPQLVRVLTFTPRTTALGFLYQSFHQLILDLHDPNVQNIDANPFVKNFYKKVCSGYDSEGKAFWLTFKPFQQQDASEFLTKLLNLFSSVPNIQIIFASTLESKLTCSNVGCIGCSVRYDSIHGLELALGGVHSVQQALHKYFAHEVLSDNNRWRCHNCGQSVRATKSMRLSTVAETLVFYPQTFTYLNTPIPYP